MQVRSNFPDISYLIKTQKNNFQFLNLSVSLNSLLASVIFANSLDPDQALQNVGLDLDLNYVTL